MTERTQPTFDAAKLDSAISASGLTIEAAAFFAATAAGWRVAHGVRYNEGSERVREIDVLASRRFEVVVKGHDPAEGYLWLPIEGKGAAQWWVFVDLEGKQPEAGDYFFPEPRSGVSGQVLAFVAEAVAENWQRGHPLPVRATSFREFSFDYKRPKREQVYGACQQALSAMKGFHGFKTAERFSLTNLRLEGFMPVVVTDVSPVVARAVDGGRAYEYNRAEWVVSGNQSEIVHVVSPVGLERLLDFAEDVVAGLESVGARDFIEKRFGL